MRRSWIAASPSAPRNDGVKILILLLLLAPGLCAPANAMESLTIMADSSMSVPLAEIARHYSRERQVVVNMSFAAPKAQEMQITEGGAADLLITPNQPWLERLKTQGVIDIHSQEPVAKNRLVLAAPLDSPALAADDIPGLIAALGAGKSLLMANENALPEGFYGRRAVHNLKMETALEPYMAYGNDIGQMLDAVEKNKSYGIVFYSSAAADPHVRAIDFFPPATYPPINYYGVVVAGDNMAEARKFLAYVAAPEAQKIFRKNGFVAP